MSKLTITGIENEITNRIAVIDSEIQLIEKLKLVSARDDTLLLGHVNNLICKNTTKAELKGLLAKIQTGGAS